MLIHPVATHWNLLTETIICVLELQCALDMVVELAKYNRPGQTKLLQFLLEDNEWEILHQLVPLLDVSDLFYCVLTYIHCLHPPTSISWRQPGKCHMPKHCSCIRSSPTWIAWWWAWVTSMQTLTSIQWFALQQAVAMLSWINSMAWPRNHISSGWQCICSFTAVCIIQGMRLFILKKNKCLVNVISPSILHGMIWIYFLSYSLKNRLVHHNKTLLI